VQTLDELAGLDAALLRDVGVLELQRRRFVNATHALGRNSRLDSGLVSAAAVQRGGCVPKALLRAAGLGPRLRNSLLDDFAVVTVADLLVLQRPDLIAAGLRTQQRRRFRLLVDLVQHNACMSSSPDNGLAERQGLRRKATEQFAQTLRAKLGAQMPGTAAPALLPTAVPVFGEGPTTHLTANHAAHWLPWTPSAKPIPEEHPLGHACINGTLRLPGPLEVNMCLSAHDHVSKQLALHGRWRDCKALVREWHKSGSDYRDNVAVELGANIGACTLELLLLTNASVAAFEPSPVNLFYLTRTLSKLAARWPSIARRVAIFPIGAGDATGRLQMSHEDGNLGNSRFAAQQGVGLARSGGERIMTKGAIDVYPLDSIFPHLPKPVRLAKFDVRHPPHMSSIKPALLVGVGVAASAL
jgi:FkbM family methyltransferase